MMVLQLGLVFLITAGLSAWLSGASSETPRTDGTPVLAGGFTTAALMLVPQGWLDWEQATAFLVSGVLLSLAGFASKSERLRRPALTAIALSAVLTGLGFLWIIPSYGRIPALPLIPDAWNPPWVSLIVMAILMTGIAGLGRQLDRNSGSAALAGILLALPTAVMAYLQGAYCHGWLITAYAAVCGGFYAYNKSPAMLLPGIGGGMWFGLTPGLLAALSADTVGLHIWLPALTAYGLVLVWLSRNVQKKA